MCQDSFIYAPLRHHTRRRRCLICLKSYRKRAINYRALLRKITHKDKACYASTPHYSWARRHCKVLQSVAVRCSELQLVAACCSVLQCVAVSFTYVLQSHSHIRHDSITPWPRKTWLIVCVCVYVYSFDITPSWWCLHLYHFDMTHSCLCVHIYIYMYIYTYIYIYIIISNSRQIPFHVYICIKIVYIGCNTYETRLYNTWSRT